MSHPLITLLTDFGSRDAYVGILKGVVLGLCPEAPLVDLSHEVPPQNVAIGALMLRSAVPFFPAGTIHLAVVDPGVGSDRAAVLVQTARGYLIGPDNGLLAPAASLLGIERVFEITNPAYRLPNVSRTFHGRDVFAPAAGHLAAGAAPGSFGPPRDGLLDLSLPSVQRRKDGIVGEVIYIDTFGNLITNIGEADLADFPRSAVSVSISKCASIPLVSTYAGVPRGSPAALIGSWGQLEIAVREGSAAARCRARLGTAVEVQKG